MSQEFALGQRTGKMILDSAWQDDELKLLVDNDIQSVDPVIKHWIMNGGDDTLNAAIGAVLLTSKGLGSQERNMPNQTQAQADASATINPSEANAPIQNIGDLPSSTDTAL